MNGSAEGWWNVPNHACERFLKRRSGRPLLLARGRLLIKAGLGAGRKDVLHLGQVVHDTRLGLPRQRISKDRVLRDRRWRSARVDGQTNAIGLSSQPPPSDLMDEFLELNLNELGSQTT